MEHEGQGKRFFEVEGKYMNPHMWHHHGRYEHTVPESFSIDSQVQFDSINQDNKYLQAAVHEIQFEFREPGGEIIIALYPSEVKPGDVILVKF